MIRNKIRLIGVSNQNITELWWNYFLKDNSNSLVSLIGEISDDNPSRTSKPSFQVNGFGGAKLVRAKEMYQFGIIPINQGVYFLNAESF